MKKEYEMTKDKALREAIDTLKSTKHGNCDFAWIDETLKKCTEALAQPVQEPVTWDKPSDNFNAWWDSDRRRDNANPFQTDSFAYWAWEGWQAALAQRQWVGLTDVDVKNLELTSATSSDVRNISAELKEKNT